MSEELKLLESFVRYGVGGYGPYRLFSQLATRYPLHFIHFMKKHRSESPNEPPDAADSRLPLVLAQLARQEQAFYEYLIYEPQPKGEKQYFEAAVERLNKLLQKDKG